MLYFETIGSNRDMNWMYWTIQKIIEMFVKNNCFKEILGLNRVRFLTGQWKTLLWRNSETKTKWCSNSNQFLDLSYNVNLIHQKILAKISKHWISLHFTGWFWSNFEGPFNHSSFGTLYFTKFYQLQTLEGSSEPGFWNSKIVLISSNKHFQNCVRMFWFSYSQTINLLACYNLQTFFWPILRKDYARQFEKPFSTILERFFETNCSSISTCTS